MTSSTKTR